MPGGDILPPAMGWTAVPQALAVSLTLMVMAAGAPVLHQHSGAAAGFYDEVCPLSQLAAGGNAGGLAPRRELTPLFTAIVLAVFLASASHSTISVSPFESRGPPSSA